MTHNLTAFNEPSLDQLDMSMVLKLIKNLEKKNKIYQSSMRHEKKFGL